MKAALIYTTTTPKLVEVVEQEIRRILPPDIEIMNYSDPSILTEIQERGQVTPTAASRLVRMYMQAINDGTDVILNICSSVGEVADAMQGFADYIGIPIVRIDEAMCREAVRLGKKIAVMATVPTTLEPTKHTILRAAEELNREVELVDCLVEGAFGLEPEQFQKRMTECALGVAEQVDVILLAQGSMAYCEALLHEQCGKTVLSSPRFGSAALKEALEKVIENRL